jgi:P27 family predicted phage terminase small subunit
LRASLALDGTSVSVVAGKAASVRGRKPTPTVLRLLRNNPGKRPINAHEPEPGDLSTLCPEELTDPVSRADLDRAIVPAIEIGQITAADRSFAIAHCELWATWRSQLSDAGRHAHVISAGKNKYPMPNPARMMANKTLLLLAKVDAELGFTPSSRSRVSTKKKSAGNKKKERFFGTGHGT